MRTLYFFFFFFLCTRRKKLIRNRPRTIPVFIYVCYIICPYQFLDIVGLHRLFIYFQYGCTLTSQTEHISAVYFKRAATSQPKIKLEQLDGEPSHIPAPVPSHISMHIKIPNVFLQSSSIRLSPLKVLRF